MKRKWMGLITSILYFTAGPIALLSGIDRITGQGPSVTGARWLGALTVLCLLGIAVSVGNWMILEFDE